MTIFAISFWNFSCCLCCGLVRSILTVELRLSVERIVSPSPHGVAFSNNHPALFTPLEMKTRRIKKIHHDGWGLKQNESSIRINAVRVVFFKQRQTSPISAGGAPTQRRDIVQPKKNRKTKHDRTKTKSNKTNQNKTAIFCGMTR